MTKKIKDKMKPVKTPNIPNIEASLIIPKLKLEAKKRGRKKIVEEYEIKYKLQDFLKDIYKTYQLVFKSKNLDLRVKVASEIMAKLVPDMKSEVDRPNVSNYQFIIGYDTKQIESMDNKAIEGEVSN